MSWVLNKYQFSSIITSTLNVLLITISSSGIRKGHLSLAYDKHCTFAQTERLDSVYKRTTCLRQILANCSCHSSRMVLLILENSYKIMKINKSYGKLLWFCANSPQSCQKSCNIILISYKRPSYFIDWQKEAFWLAKASWTVQDEIWKSLMLLKWQVLKKNLVTDLSKKLN